MKWRYLNIINTLVRNLFAISLLLFSRGIFAEQINFECLAKITHNLVPIEFQTPDKEVARNYRYNNVSKILTNIPLNHEYQCSESDLELNCSATFGNAVWNLTINRISLSFLRENKGEKAFVIERGSCKILKMKDKKF